MATVECSYHSGHPEVAGQYAGRYWAWTPEASEDDNEALCAEVQAWLEDEAERVEGFELRIPEGTGTIVTPNVEIVWDEDNLGMMEALWVCPAEDHDGEDCACYVERLEFRITWDS